MGWAHPHIEKLRAGETVKFRPHGNSMLPRVKSGQLCTVAPLTIDLKVGDIVLCRVKGREYLHYIKAVKDGRYQIGNARGFINGWVGLDQIFGYLTEIAP